MAWGNLEQGQAVPEALESAASVVAIAAGAYHSLALMADGEVRGWGLNAKYQVDPIPELARSGVQAIAAGDEHSLALRDGMVMAWGANDDGQTQVPDAAKQNIIAIAAGRRHSLALTSMGEVVGWGRNATGQVEIPARARSGVIAIAAGGSHSLALLGSGTVLGWGAGQEAPPPAARTGVTAIAAGDDHSLAIVNGRVIAWGQGSLGQTNVRAPAAVPGAVQAIAAGYGTSYALLRTGQVVAWGVSKHGQDKPNPSTLFNTIAISSGPGSAHCLALVHDRVVTAPPPPPSAPGLQLQPVAEASTGAGASIPGRWMHCESTHVSCLSHGNVCVDITPLC